MHIGIDCRLPTYQMGGISQYTIHLIQALGNLPIDDRYTILQSHRERRSFLPEGNSSFSRSDLWTPCHHPLERYALGMEILPHRVDVFHSPDFIPPAFGARRRIITVHDLTFLYYPEFLTAESRRYYADQIEWAVSAADHIIADSEATRIDIINMLGVAESKATTIHMAANPIYTRIYSSQEIQRTVTELGVGEGFILGVGTLEPRKNWPMLLRVYDVLRRDHHISVPLVLVGGKGWMYGEIFETISHLGLDSWVLHLSGISDVQLAHLYRVAGVLAFPSHYEGFGLPALEAMHAGCPIVASNRGSLPEVVGDAAVSLDPDDLDGWVMALQRILGDSEYAKSLALSGLHQARKFTWAKTAAATAAIYSAGSTQ